MFSPLQSSLSNKPPEFLEFLHGLGWIVNPRTHPGFAGRLRPSKTEDAARPVGVSAQIPSRPFPYYADAITELAFVVPTLRPSAGDSSASLRSVESSDSNQDVSASYNMLQSQQTASTAAVPMPVVQLHPPPPGLSTQQSLPATVVSQPATTTSQPMPTSAAQEPTPPSSSVPKHDSVYMNIDAFPTKDPVGSGVSESSAIAEGYATYPGISRAKKYSKSEAQGSDTPRRRWAVPLDGAALVVWLEKLDDHQGFPTEMLSRLLHGVAFSGFGSHKISHSAKKSLPVIFIHKMSSGLYQIVTDNSGGR